MGLFDTIGGWLGLGNKEAPAPTYNQQYQMPHFGQQYSQYGQMANQFGNRQNSSFRGGQSNLIDMLQQQAMGHGAGQQLVRRQAQDAADQALRQQLAAQAGAGPGSGAMAARNAAMGAASAQSAVGGQAATAGLQAQLGAMGMLGSTLQSARGQDLQNQQMNDQAQLEALRQRLGLAQAQQQGGLAYNQNLTSYGNNLMQQPRPGQALLGGLGGLGMGFMLGRNGNKQ